MFRPKLLLLAAALLALPLAASAQTVSGPKDLSGTTCPTACLEVNVSEKGSATIELGGSGTAAVYGIVAQQFDQYQVIPANGGAAVSTITAPGKWILPVAGLQRLRVIALSGTPTAAIGVAVSGGSSGSASITTGAVTASGLTHDPDDASIASGQDNDNVNALNHIFDGVVWRRMTFGTAASPSTQVQTVQGITSMTPLLVNGSGVTQPVSGTFWQATQPVSGTVAATQSGTWTLQPGNTANTTAWLFAGGKTNNNAAPGATNFGSLGFIANAAAPSWTEGNLVAGSVDLAGNLRVATHAVTGSGNFTATQATGTNLHMVCDSGCSSSAGFADNAAFTYGTTAVNPIAGVLDDVATNAPTENSAAVVRITTAKALHTNLAQYLGAAISATNPVAIRISDGSAFYTQDTQLTYNTAPTWASVTAGAQFFRASTAAPTAVTTDRPVAPWGTTGGALHMQPSYGDVEAATGVGAAGATVPRFNDTASGTTGLAVPAQGAYIAGNAGGLLQGIPVCDQQAKIEMTTATTTQLVALTSAKKVHICHIRLQAGGTTTATFKEGTGSNCGTGTTSISEAEELTAQTGYVAGTGVGEVLANDTTANAVCVTNSAAVNLHVFVRYTVY